MTTAYPIRKSPRAQWFDYNESAYFITICTKDMRHFFGEISDDEMHLTPVGTFLHNELSNPANHHPHIAVPLFTVMPNHVHLIVSVGTRRAASANGESYPSVGTRRAASADNDASSIADMARHVPTTPADIHVPTRHTLLGAYIGSVKSSVTRYATLNGFSFAWQPRYHDHIIRGFDDANKISRYISENVLRWQYDRFNQ